MYRRWLEVQGIHACRAQFPVSLTLAPILAASLTDFGISKTVSMNPTCLAPEEEPLTRSHTDR
jgi:hypothetical protein